MTKPVKLTAADWIEIYYAVESKLTAMMDGRYGILDAVEDRLELTDWANHLQAILDKIGPDGLSAAQLGVETATRR